MALLIRSWNLFQGNTKPAQRRAFLDEMVRLVCADGPDAVCLQEVPAWALGRLGEWSGMQTFGDLAAPPRIGPLPSTAEIGRALTSLNHGLLRSAFAGQGNAILLAPRLRPLSRDAIALNGRSFRRAQASWLGLALIPRLAWAKERRICQVVRAALPDGRVLTLANLHATSYPADRRLADAELLRAAVFTDGLARPDDVVVLAGDFNVERSRSETLGSLASPGWGFSLAAERGIDHVLVRGAETGAVARWPDERRRQDGFLLSDHAPIEVEVR